MHELHFQFSKLYYGLLLEILRFLFGVLLWETPCISFFNQKLTLFGNICRFVFVYYFYVTLPEKFHLDYKLVKLYTSPNQKRLYKKVADSYEYLEILIYF